MPDILQEDLSEWIHQTGFCQVHIAKAFGYPGNADKISCPIHQYQS